MWRIWSQSAFIQFVSFFFFFFFFVKNGKIYILLKVDSIFFSDMIQFIISEVCSIKINYPFSMKHHTLCLYYCIHFLSSYRYQNNKTFPHGSFSSPARLYWRYSIMSEVWHLRTAVLAGGDILNPKSLLFMDIKDLVITKFEKYMKQFHN